MSAAGAGSLLPVRSGAPPRPLTSSTIKMDHEPTSVQAPRMSTEPLDPQEIADAPELLILETLDACLHTLGIALVLAYPRLADGYAPQRDGPAWRAARRLSTRAHQLTKAIASYRKVLRVQPKPPPDPIDSYF